MVGKPCRLSFWALTALPLVGYAQEKGKDAPFLPTGTVVRATITNAIFSYNLTTPVVAQLDEGASFPEGRLVLPPKTKLIGTAMVVKSHDRVNIEFGLAVLPEGREVEISAIALWPDGSAGIKGTVKKHKDSMVASSALKGAILGGSAMVSAAAANPALAEATQTAARDAAQEIDLSREQVDTSITVPVFTRCLVFLNRRLEIGERPKEDGLGAR